MKSDVETDTSDDEEPGPECLRDETDSNNSTTDIETARDNAEDDGESSEVGSDGESGKF